jgi:dihydrodipicolinate synthase/N-acetylneuraminate lyase
MPEYSVDLLKAGLNGDFVELKQKLQMLDPFEDYAAKISQKYGPSTTILPYPYANSYMMYGVFKAAMDMLGLAGGHMRLPMLDIKDEDKKELRNIIFEKWNLNKVK